MLPPLQDPNETPRHFSATTARFGEITETFNKSSKEYEQRPRKLRSRSMEEKNMAPSDSRAYRHEAEDKRLFRDAIQLAIIDAKTPTTVRAQWVMTKDFQRVGRYLHQFSEPLHE
ncbi:hypothetical protein TNCV_840481 [Trichonephila clavipes]|nr:hypothetical protein TNCV_840481 [Trichonephila clavipes]